ncbi:C4-dicarboxylate TRAP transporter substrate-binding protein [Corynebacterium sp. YIM 101645]|uniref:C4-dicarboxylate TRAP transporter substrate-binding protein n=1 Tax=Corynebacterium lemuris TaxID=1859292 RepID=A0ABT2FSE7_9CORY|nr:C4-dicarboxylate TRAP transporter substrate-binding protein [Corynebacterium lemuris]
MKEIRRPARKAARYVIATLAVAGTFAVAACGGGSSASNGDAAPGGAEGIEELTLSYSDLTSATSPAGEAVQEWIDALDEDSGGNVVVEPYWSSSLLTSDDALSGTGSGISDITYTVVTYQPQALPVANWLNEQGSLPVDSYPHNQLQTVGVMNEMFNTEDMAAEFEVQGVKFLASTSVAGKYDLLCSKELTDQTDLSGLRVRAPGPVWAAEAEALGMTVVNVAQGETYEALQRGLIDCQIGAPFMYEDYGLNEVAKHYYPAGFSANMGLVLLMNLDRWESLSPETQTFLQDSMQKYATGRTQADINSQMAFFDRREELGITTHDVTEMNAVLAEFQESQRETWLDRAPAGVSDPADTGEVLTAAIESWGETVTEDVDLAEPGEVASESIEDFPAWQARLDEVFAGRTQD